MVNFIWVSLVIYPLYFGYTGSDSAAATLRSILFLVGSIVTSIGIRMSKKIDIKEHLPLIMVLHGIFFYGSYAFLLEINPYEDRFDSSGLILVFLAAMAGNFFSTIWMLSFQKILVDIVPDENRNSFYSLSPTIGLLLSAGAVVWVGRFVQARGDLVLTVLLFSVLPTLAVAVVLFISLRDYVPTDKEEDPLLQHLAALDLTMGGLEATFGITRIPQKWKIQHVVKESWKELLRIALQDGEIDTDEHQLLEKIVADVKSYGELLENALEDGIITFQEHQQLVDERHKILDEAQFVASSDEKITDDEQALLDKLIEIVQRLEKLERY